MELSFVGEQLAQNIAQYCRYDRISDWQIVRSTVFEVEKSDTISYRTGCDTNLSDATDTNYDFYRAACNADAVQR